MNVDVIAVNLKDHTVRLLTQKETEQDAEAIIKMAVMRRGVEEEFYAKVAVGMYRDGDSWTGDSLL